MIAGGARSRTSLAAWLVGWAALAEIGCGAPVRRLDPAPALPATQPETAPAGPGTVTLEVRVEGISAARGVVRITVFASAEGFPAAHTKALRNAVVPADPAGVSARFLLPAGDCAVAVIHDANDNGRLDTNWMGVPVEPFGVSNNPKSLFGPPTFEKARLSLPEAGLRILVELH